MTGSVPNGHYADALHTAGSTQASATYSYASKTTACAACHAMALAGEHARTTSNLTGEGETVCTKCHNDSQAIADIIKAGWVAKDTASACAACHAGTDGTSAATAHGSVATAHTGTSVTGCTGLGAGCHGTSATPDLTVVHASGCAQARACHSPTVYNPGAKNCTNALCHPSAVYNTTTYAHGAVDGTDPAHTVAAASMDTVVRVGTGSATATCSTCHASTLKSAHDTAAGHATASLGWTNECRGCHNATSPIDVAALVASNSWTKSCTGNGCHDTAQAAHVAGGTAVPAVAGSNSTTPACTKSGCHSTLELHALHKNASGGCGLSDPNGGCHTAANRDRRPTQRTCGDVGGCHEGIQDDGAHGVSSGGVPCDVCHSALTGMVDDRDAYHHVLDGPDPFMAPNVGGAYPTSKTDLACVSCHVDHDKYSALPGGAGKAFSLRSSATSSNPVVADTDDTLCMSCHTTALARNVIGQKDNVIPEPGVWKIEQLWWDVSPHNYTAPGDFNDGSTFHANCAKCHGTLGGTLSTGKFAVHFSPEQRLINALGDTVTYNVNEEQMCFRCHSLVTDFTAYGGPQPGIPKPSSYVDWYGTQSMKVSNVVIFQQMTSGNNGHGHKPHLYHNIHLLNETQAQISATKHVECADCHNHHVVGTARHEFGTTNTVSDAIRGVTGQAFTSTNIGTTNMPSDAQVNSNLSWKTYSDYEYEICFKCHSSANTNYATWGGNKSSLSDVGAAKPYNWAAYVGPSPTVTAPRWTNIAKDFHVGNQSRHPVLAPLPTTDPSTSYGSSRVYAGQLSAGWKPGDTMYCSDCHGDPNAPSPWQLDVNGSPVLDVNGDPIINPAMANFAQGPHGSSVAFSLRGPRTDWPIATTGPQAGQLITLNMLNAGYDNLFCTNCHPGVRANKVHGGGQGTHAAAACVNCHILIPHGGGMSRLIGDGEGPSGGPSAMPVRYAYNNDKRTMYVASFNKKADPSTYAKGDCSVTSQAGATCGGGGQRHVTGNNASLENW
jgi:hypothetical protein